MTIRLVNKNGNPLLSFGKSKKEKRQLIIWRVPAKGDNVILYDYAIEVSHPTRYFFMKDGNLCGIEAADFSEIELSGYEYKLLIQALGSVNVPLGWWKEEDVEMVNRPRKTKTPYPGFMDKKFLGLLKERFKKERKVEAE